MINSQAETRHPGSRLRLVVMVVVGVISGIATGLAGQAEFAAIVGWSAACVVYIAWVWAVVGRMDGAATRSHASIEEPGRSLTDVFIVGAALASVADLLFVFAQASRSGGDSRTAALAVVAVVSLALSWGLVHTLYTLRYARLYYQLGGGIDFGRRSDPRYVDFAYVAFTLGMTFQVSDTTISETRIRATALRHGLLSYLFGSVILAATVNLVAGLMA